MIRNLVVIAVATFVLTIACLAGALALGGRDLVQHGWTIPMNWRYSVSDQNGSERSQVTADSGSLTVAERSALANRELAWTGGDTLQIDLPAQVTFTQGSTAKVVVTGPKAILDRVVVEDGHLRLLDGDEEGGLTIDRHGIRFMNDTDRLKIAVTAPSVEHFVVNASGDLDIQGYDRSDLKVEINGSGDVAAHGKAERIEMAVSGSGDADLAGVLAKTATVRISGSGDAELSATDTVDVDIAGSGDVTLRRRPANLTKAISGSGDIYEN